MAQILESLMLISFGLSWPVNIVKSYRSRTAKGKSLLFLIFIFFGYLCGIAAKIALEAVNYVCVFYILNSVMVFADILLCLRNMRLDKNGHNLDSKP